jgi:hypothetical protein
MTEHTDRTDTMHTHGDTTHTHGDNDRVERTVDDDRRDEAHDSDRTRSVAVTEERKMSGRSFLAGFLTALVAAAIALVIFLAVSDADDDGEIQVDVPAVDVEVDG